MCSDVKAIQHVILDQLKKQGITVNKLATLSGVRQSTLDSILKGKSKNPTIQTMEKVSAGLGIPYESFVMMVNGAEIDLNLSRYNLPAQFKRLRQERYLTQKQVAAGIGIAEQAYQRYEYGKSVPSALVLIALADFFDVSLDYLVGRSDEPGRK